MKYILSEAGNWVKIFYLLIFSFLGLFVAILILTGFSAFFGMTDSLNLSYIRLSSLLQEVFVFLVPSFVVAFWSNRNPWQLLELHGGKRLPSGIIFGVVIFCVAYPFISYITEWNMQIVFPESMKGIETQMRSMENVAQQTTDKLLEGKNPWNFILNILFVAGLAALSILWFFLSINYGGNAWLFIFVFQKLMGANCCSFF